MHYIRFLRLPSIERGRSNFYIKIVVAISTDLGDSFLDPEEPIEISVIGAYPSLKDGQKTLVPVILTPGSAPRWRAGMRVLKMDLPLPSDQIETVQVRPSNRKLAALGTFDMYPATGEGLILGAYADVSSSPATRAPAACFRSLRLTTADTAATTALQVQEDIGDSIARHIWDAGILTVSLVADMCLRPTAPLSNEPLPLLSAILRRRDRPLSFLELGCGIGTLGIGIARVLASMPPPEQSEAGHVLMTDLPDAEKWARANITRCLGQAQPSHGAMPQIDYENLDWNDGKDGVFGDKAQSRPWDLVILSDCTYNDMLPTLVQTLSAIHSHSVQRAVAEDTPTDTKIMLSTKLRHPSERAFFKLMSADGWLVEEKTMLPLPVLSAEPQTVEVYLFSKK